MRWTQANKMCRHILVSCSLSSWDLAGFPEPSFKSWVGDREEAGGQQTEREQERLACTGPSCHAGCSRRLCWVMAGVGLRGGHWSEMPLQTFWSGNGWWWNWILCRECWSEMPLQTSCWLGVKHQITYLFTADLSVRGGWRWNWILCDADDLQFKVSQALIILCFKLAEVRPEHRIHASCLCVLFVLFVHLLRRRQSDGTFHDCVIVWASFWPVLISGVLSNFLVDAFHSQSSSAQCRWFLWM